MFPTSGRVAALLTCFTIGCVPGAGGPKPGAIPTGDRVAVVDDVVRWTTAYDEKVAHTDYTNADGETVGGKDTYVTKHEEHAKAVWYPVQGRQQLADEDFFKITGDAESQKLTTDLRARGRRYLVLGTGGMVVGIASMLVGEYAFRSNRTAMIGFMLGGSITGLAGLYGFYRGREMVSPTEHAVDRSIADQDAASYNAKLGRGASLNLLRGKF
jgi:hypothetical protein